MKASFLVGLIGAGIQGSRSPRMHEEEGAAHGLRYRYRLIDLDQLGVQVECFQTNIEGEMAARIHRAHEEGTDAVLINAGAWTHYSYGIRDALAILKVPIIEVHMSNIHAREEFRHHSVIGPIARGQIAGFGVESYLLALRAAVSAAREAKK